MNISDLALFVRTADCGSLSRAAEQLEMSQAEASAGLKRLEKQLEQTLFIRPSGRLQLTSEGERYLIYCREALSSLKQGITAIGGFESEVCGDISIAAPADIGRGLLLECLDQLMQQYPALSVKLVLTDSLAGFGMEGIDLALTYSKPHVPSMQVNKLASIDSVVCAAPSYLEQNGEPDEPLELSLHNCLVLQSDCRIQDTWAFVKMHKAHTSSKTVQVSEPIEVKVSGQLSASDGDIIRHWAVAGKGVMYSPKLEVKRHLESGELVQILPEYQLTLADLYLVSPKAKSLSSSIAIVRDYLIERIAEQLKA